MSERFPCVRDVDRGGRYVRDGGADDRVDLAEVVGDGDQCFGPRVLRRDRENVGGREGRVVGGEVEDGTSYWSVGYCTVLEADVDACGEDVGRKVVGMNVRNDPCAPEVAYREVGHTGSNLHNEVQAHDGLDGRNGDRVLVGTCGLYGVTVGRGADADRVAMGLP